MHIPACCYARRLSATRTLHTAGPVSILPGPANNPPHQTKQHYKVRLFDRHTHISYTYTVYCTLDIIHRHYYAPCTIMSNTCYNNAASDNIALKHNQLSQMKHQLLQLPPPTQFAICRPTQAHAHTQPPTCIIHFAHNPDVSTLRMTIGTKLVMKDHNRSQGYNG